MASDQGTRTRRVRWLIGWSDPEAAIAALAGRRKSELSRPEHRERAELARQAAARRPPSFAADGVVSEPPSSIQDREGALAEELGLQAALAQGMRIGLVDLRR